MQFDGEGLDFDSQSEEGGAKGELDKKRSKEDETKDADGVPYCRIHHCRMKVTSVRKDKRYFKCPAKDCKETGKAIRLKIANVVPEAPLECPRCSRKRGEKKGPVYCERDDRVSDSMRIILSCPLCEWKSSPQATPQFASEAEYRRGRKTPEPVDDLGER